MRHGNVGSGRRKLGPGRKRPDLPGGKKHKKENRKEKPKKKKWEDDSHLENRLPQYKMVDLDERRLPSFYLKTSLGTKKWSMIGGEEEGGKHRVVVLSETPRPLKKKGFSLLGWKRFSEGGSNGTGTLDSPTF